MSDFKITKFPYSYRRNIKQLMASQRKAFKEKFPGLDAGTHHFLIQRFMYSGGAYIVEGQFEPKDVVNLQKEIQNKLGSYDPSYYIVVKPHPSSNLEDCTFIKPSEYGKGLALVQNGSVVPKPPKGIEDFYGSPKDDKFVGGESKATFFGGRGQDTFTGGSSNENFWGGDDNDIIHGNIGKDRLCGQNGNDTLLGGDGDDYLIGDDGYLIGRGGDDELTGGKGDDMLEGGPGNNKYFYARDEKGYFATDHDTIQLGEELGHDQIVFDDRGKVNFIAYWDDQYQQAKIFLLDAKKSYDGKNDITVRGFSFSRSLSVAIDGRSQSKLSVYTIEYVPSSAKDKVYKMNVLLPDNNLFGATKREVLLPQGYAFLRLTGPDGNPVEGVSRKVVTDTSENNRLNALFSAGGSVR